jgi:hypothetical protein
MLAVIGVITFSFVLANERRDYVTQLAEVIRDRRIQGRAGVADEHRETRAGQDR